MRTKFSTHPVNLNGADHDPSYDDGGCALVLVRAATVAALVCCACLTAYSGYATLTAEETHEYAMKVQRAWHWSAYSDAAKAEIAQRVQRLIEQNPRGYLAKIAGQVYR